jgi:hypothetical protein
MERPVTQVTPNGDENSGQFVMTTFLLFSLCLYLLLVPCIVMENQKYLTIGGVRYHSGGSMELNACTRCVLMISGKSQTKKIR